MSIDSNKIVYILCVFFKFHSPSNSFFNLFNKMSLCSKLKNFLNLVHHRLRSNIHYVEGTSLTEDSAESVVLTGKKVDGNVTNKLGQYLWRIHVH